MMEWKMLRLGEQEGGAAGKGYKEGQGEGHSKERGKREYEYDT